MSATNSTSATTPAIKELDVLLASMSAELVPGEFVFCTVDPKTGSSLKDFLDLEPLATFREKEGLTLVLDKAAALKFNERQQHQAGKEASADGEPATATEPLSVFRQITLNVHSSLDAVGLTAAVATRLTEGGFSANVVAAYYHDHFFVKAAEAEAVLASLKEFEAENKRKAKTAE